MSMMAMIRNAYSKPATPSKNAKSAPPSTLNKIVFFIFSPLKVLISRIHTRKKRA